MTEATAVTATALTEYDFIVLIDASGSMGTEDMGVGRSRWQAMQETVETFCRDLGKLDSDGIGVVVFSGTGIDAYDGVTVDKVAEIFRQRAPRGGTPLAEGLQAALKLAGKSDKKDFILTFTDGVPDDKAAAAQVIVDASHRIAADEDLTFLFVQVGYDAAASAYLQTLDDDLTGAKFDIVDVKTMREAEQFASTTDLILAAIAD